MAGQPKLTDHQVGSVHHVLHHGMKVVPVHHMLGSGIRRASKLVGGNKAPAAAFGLHAPTASALPQVAVEMPGQVDGQAPPIATEVQASQALVAQKPRHAEDGFASTPARLAV